MGAIGRFGFGRAGTGLLAGAASALVAWRASVEWRWTEIAGPPGPIRLELPEGPAAFARLVELAGGARVARDLVADQLLFVPAYVFLMLLVAHRLHAPRPGRLGAGTVLGLLTALVAAADTAENVLTHAALARVAEVGSPSLAAAVAGIFRASAVKWLALAAAAGVVARDLGRGEGPLRWLGLPAVFAALAMLTGLASGRVELVTTGFAAAVLTLGGGLALAPAEGKADVGPTVQGLALGAVVVGACAVPAVGWLTWPNAARSLLLVTAGVLWSLREVPLPRTPERVLAWLGNLGVLGAGASVAGLLDGLGTARVHLGTGELVAHLAGVSSVPTWSTSVDFWGTLLDDGVVALVAATGFVGAAAAATWRWSGPVPREPLDVRAAEEAWIAAAREARGHDPKAPRLGLACSGGGIRAAAFGAGVLEALERSDVLPAVDVATAASGGSWAVVGWWRSRRKPSELRPTWTESSDYLRLRDPLHSPFLRGVLRAARRDLVVLGGGLVGAALALWAGFLVLAVGSPPASSERAGTSAAEEVRALFGCDEQPVPLACRVLAPEPVAEGAGPIGRLLGADGVPEPATEAAALADAVLAPATPLIGLALGAALVFFAIGAVVMWPSPVAGRLIVRRSWRATSLLALGWATAARAALFAPLVIGVVAGGIATWRSGQRRERAGGWIVAEPVAVVGVAVAWAFGLDALTAPATAWVLDRVDGFLAWPLVGLDGPGRATVTLLGTALTPAAWGAIWALSSSLDRDRLSLHTIWREAIARVFRVAEDLADLVERRAAGRPLLVVVTTANVPDTHDRARRRRGTALLEWTPLHAGSAELGHVEVGAYAKRVDLADVVAVSSAAVSSQMGFGYPRALQWLLGALNFRLGRWLPNPARLRPGQLVAEQGGGFLPRVFAELGLSGSEADPDLFVTDGGHDENTGLVSLLRRGCDAAVVVDADADQARSADQLRAVLRRLKEEEGWRLDPGEERAWQLEAKRPVWPAPWLEAEARARFAVRLRLTHADGRIADVLCLRLAVPADAPAVVSSYQRRDPVFPTHPMFVQGFSRDAFAAYAALGGCAEREIRAWWAVVRARRVA